MSNADSVSRIPRVEAKLRAPRVTRGLVPRPRLTVREVAGGEPLLTLVSAPAGFGKTTLLGEWFAERDRPTAWLALDAGDSDPAVFWSYLVASIQAAVPDAGSEAESLLDAGNTIEAVTASLLNDLEAFATDLVVVLDDFHFVESHEVPESLGFFLEHLPPQVHVVIATRVDPLLPLARLRARGELLEIRAADLRFTANEASTYFQDAMGVELGTDAIAALEARTEGWIAALQLAALSLRGRDDVDEFIASFAGDDRFVVDYLLEEVLERQSEDVRNFLLDTSILARLEGSLCDAVTATSGGRAMLEQLERANLFIVPLDDRRSWYRYHHLFGDVLRARLVDEQPARVRELHQRASGWFDAHDDPIAAITHAMAGEHFARAAHLIELATPMLRRTRQEGAMRRWLEALPAEVLAVRPVLNLTLAGTRLSFGDITGVEELVTVAESHLDRPDAIVFDTHEFARLPTQAATFRSGLALLKGDVETAMSQAHRALDLAAANDHLAHGSSKALLGLGYWASGNLADARPLYVEAISHLDAAGHHADVLGLYLGLADIEVAQGQLRDAHGTFERGLAHAARHPGLRGTADMHVGLSEVLLERNDLGAAGDHLKASTELGEHAGLPQHPYRWRVATARIREAEGDVASALALLKEAERVFNTDFSPAVRPVEALKARMQVAHGDIDAAQRWMTERGLSADTAVEYVREFELVTVARIMLASGEVEAALGLLGRLLRAAEAGGRNGTAVELRMLKAVAEDARGNVIGAIDALEEALVAAAPEGYIRVFFEAASLLRAVKPTSPASQHARRVLAAATAPVRTPPRRDLVDELSSRELDVLRLLRSDLSGPDIAREMVVSLNTFRTHTKNIYAKLGVNNRREAVTRAQELGL